MTQGNADEHQARKSLAEVPSDAWVPVLSVMFLTACAAAPLDLVTCEGSPAVVNWRYSEYEHEHRRMALESQKFALLLNNCWGLGSSADERVAACSRAIDSGSLSTQDRTIALDCRGNWRAVRSEYDRAIEDYSEAIGLDPYNSDVFSDRGAAWIAKGNMDRGIADFDKAIQLQPKFMNPRYAVVYSNRAAAWLAKGDYDRAIADATWAIGYARSAAPYANRGLAWNLKGDVDRAIDDLDAAVQLAPKNSMLRIMRGNAYAKKGANDLAMDDYNEAIRLNPRSAVAYMNRAALWRGKGDVQRAIADHDEGARIAPCLQDGAEDKGCLPN